MNHNFFYLVLITTIFLSFSYGLAVGAYKIFPYKQILAFTELVLYDRNETNERNREYRIKIFEKFSPPVDSVFIGDSITEYGEWNDFFSSKNLSNRGVAGDTTEDILRRLDSIISTKANSAFVMAGINDIYAKISIKKIVDNYRQIVSFLKEENFEVIVQSTIQCQLEVCGKEKVSQINLLNRELELLSKKKAISFLSLDELSNINGLDKKYTYDGVHINAEGYNYWVEKINSEFHIIK